MKYGKKLLICMMLLLAIACLTGCTEDPSNDSNVNSATDGTKGETDDGILDDAMEDVEEMTDDAMEGMEDWTEDMEEDRADESKDMIEDESDNSAVTE